MNNQWKTTGLIIFLVAAGVIIFLLSLQSGNRKPEQGVLLQDIFHRPIEKRVPPSVAALPSKKADPVPPLAIVASIENGHESGFAIQVYSFQDRHRAQAALASLKNSGYRAFMVVSDLGAKGVWYRVRISGIADQTAAHKMLEDIRRNYNSGFILKPKN